MLYDSEVIFIKRFGKKFELWSYKAMLSAWIVNQLAETALQVTTPDDLLLAERIMSLSTGESS